MEEKNSQNVSLSSMFTYLNKFQEYIKKYAENCRHSFNSMLSI